MNYGYTPFWSFQAPAGDVLQRITTPLLSPSFTVNYAGNPVVEERVVTQVASYGRQIGWLTDIVLALAEGKDIAPETRAALKKLKTACEQIGKIKSEVRQSAYLEASDALDRLQKEHPHGYKDLIERRNGSLRRT